MGKIINLLGQRFGRLTVLEYAGKSKTRNALWYCRCDCTNYITTEGYSLTSGHTTSCGCYRIEQVKKAYKKYNTFDLTGEFGIGYDANNNFFYFDLEDYEKISQIYWRIDKHGYVVNFEGNNMLRFHNFIMGVEEISPKVEIDHINRIKNDNRKENLRIANRQQNSRNSSKKSNNTSGFIGVCFNKKINMWIAQIVIDSKNIRIGNYEFKEDAIVARLQAEKYYFGEFAPQRHLFEQYGII